MFLSGLLSLIIAILSFTLSPFLLLLFLPLLFILFLKKKPKSFFVASLIGLGVGLLLSLLPRGSEGEKELLGICVLRKDSYIYLLTIEGKYLVYDDGKIPLFSIAKVSGNSQQALFSHYESGFDYAAYLKTQGVFYKLTADSVTLILNTHYKLDFLKDYCFSYLDETSQAIVASILFGESSSNIQNSVFLQDLGLTSAFTLSGFHLSFFLLIVRKLIGKKLKTSYDYIELVFVFLFLFLSGFRYAMRRIFLLKILYKFNSKSKKLSSLDVLSLSAIIMLVFEPYSLLSSSFYYSFPFLFFLRIFKPDFRKQKWAFTVLLLCFYLPIRLASNPVLYILSPISQIILLPISHLVFLLSLPLLLIPQIAFILNPICSFYLNIISFVHKWSPTLVNGSLNIIFALLMYLPISLFFILRTYNYKREAKATIIISLISSSLIFIPDFSNHYEVYFIDVGQGDATLIRYKKTDILIDTGGNTYTDLATECLIPFFQSKNISELDAVIITHLDYDHYGALSSLEANFQVEEVYYYYDFFEFENNTMTIKDITITNLNDYQISNDSNDNSAVYYISGEESELLIMGDAPKEVEEKLIEEYQELSCDILKIGHHGSKTSSSKEFLQAVSPSLAVISAGYNNIYKHPSEETISTLEELKIPYKRTDLEGTIQVTFK